MRTGYPGLFIPGPTNIPERVRQACAIQLEDQRAPDFPSFTLPLFADLKKVFKTDDRPGFHFPGLGHGRMGSGHHQHPVARRPCAVRGLRAVFASVGGSVSSATSSTSRLFDVEWGKGVPAEDYERSPQGRHRAQDQGGAGLPQRDRDRRDQRHRRRAPGARRCPPSGVAHCRRRVSSIASIDFRMDEWGVDLAVSGSQKGFMLPTGLAIVAVSEKALAARKTRQAAALLLRFRGHDPHQQGRLLPLHAGDHAAARPARFARHAVRGRTGKRLCAASPPGGRRAPGRQRLGPTLCAKEPKWHSDTVTAISCRKASTAMTW